MKLNTPAPTGGLAHLRRLASTCLLWEDTFYKSGSTIAEELATAVLECAPHAVASLARELRQDLRHTPLFLAALMLENPRSRRFVGDLLADIVQRPDDMCEFLALYWRNGHCPLASQVKKGLAKAFVKFSPHQLAKWANKRSTITLRDVMFLVHPRPRTPEQATAWRQLANRNLPPADTWEVALSRGEDKRATFERLLVDRKLGALALLRNLRNMYVAGVSSSLVKEALSRAATSSNLFPFNFIAAARVVPEWEPLLDEATQQNAKRLGHLEGPTTVLIDISGSMGGRLSAKSNLTRLDAALGVAIAIREMASDCSFYAFSERVVQVPPRHGMALADAIHNALPHGGTYLQEALLQIPPCDRLIIITDEQANGANVRLPPCEGFLINVAPYAKGVTLAHRWHRINGWSNNVLRYIMAEARSELVEAA